jgi:hypothetical protein
MCTKIEPQCCNYRRAPTCHNCKQMKPKGQSKGYTVGWCEKHSKFVRLTHVCDCHHSGVVLYMHGNATRSNL